jgi:hypothetical protein
MVPRSEVPGEGGCVGSASKVFRLAPPQVWCNSLKSSISGLQALHIRCRDGVRHWHAHAGHLARQLAQLWKPQSHVAHGHAADGEPPSACHGGARAHGLVRHRGVQPGAQRRPECQAQVQDGCVASGQPGGPDAAAAAARRLGDSVRERRVQGQAVHLRARARPRRRQRRHRLAWRLVRATTFDIPLPTSTTKRHTHMRWRASRLHMCTRVFGGPQDAAAGCVGSSHRYINASDVRRAAARRRTTSSTLRVVRFVIETRRGDMPIACAIFAGPSGAVHAKGHQGVPKALLFRGVIAAAGRQVGDVTLHATLEGAVRVLARPLPCPRRRFPPSTLMHAPQGASHRAHPSGSIRVSSRTTQHPRPWRPSARAARHGVLHTAKSGRVGNEGSSVRVLRPRVCWDGEQAFTSTPGHLRAHVEPYSMPSVGLKVQR